MTPPPHVHYVCMLQALLDEWRAEVARKPLAMSEAEACRLLGLKPGLDGVVAEEDLKAAYRSLARKCACLISTLLYGLASCQGGQGWSCLHSCLSLYTKRAWQVEHLPSFNALHIPLRMSCIVSSSLA